MSERWKYRIKWFLESRDYRHTWWDRLKTCIAMLTVVHLLACFLFPDIREWTLDIIVRCNDDYFSRMIEQHSSAPQQETSEPLIQYLFL